jgi:predicted helicase
LFEEIFSYLDSYGIEARYVNYNSGNADEKKYAETLKKSGGVYKSIVSTTSPKSVKEAYHVAQREHIPLIVFSTYHSSEKFAESELIPDLTIHDEAHNLVSPEFNRVAILPTGANYFFTATMKITESDLDKGMNNKEIFDVIIFQKSAKEMIEKGEMVQPRIHVVKSSKGQTIDVEKTDADYSSMFRSIVSAFKAHSEQVKKDSYDATKIGAKVLVVCRGQQDLIQMFKTKAFKKFLEENGHINIYALSSEFGLRINNTHYKPPVTNMKKYKLLKDMKAMAVDEECIIFHVDMIGEGIDVPGITGVMPFRNCEISKFVQNIGRAARLHPEDRKRFYDKEINPYMVDKYIKPCSWIIIPEFLSNSEGFSDRFKGIIRKLRSEYGITKEQVLITNDRGLADDEEIDTDNELEKVKRHSKSGINDFDHEFEEMTPIEKVIKFEEVMGRENAVADELRKVAEIGGMINENS